MAVFSRGVWRRSLVFGSVVGAAALVAGSAAFACTIYKGEFKVASWNDSPTNPIRGCATNTSSCTGGTATAVGLNGAGSDPVRVLPENGVGNIEANQGGMSYCNGTPSGVALVDSLQSATYLLTGQSRKLVVSTSGQNVDGEPCSTVAAADYKVTASNGTQSTVFVTGERDNKLPDVLAHPTLGNVAIPYKVIFGNGVYHVYTNDYVGGDVPTPNGVLGTDPDAGTWTPGPGSANVRIRTPYLGDCMYPLGPAAGINTTVDMNPAAAGVNTVTVDSNGDFTTGASGVPFNSSLVPQLTPNDESAVCISNDVVTVGGVTLLKSGWFGNQVPVDVY